MSERERRDLAGLLRRAASVIRESESADEHEELVGELEDTAAALLKGGRE